MAKKEFITNKEDTEKHKLNFKSKNLEKYNNLLTLRELKDSIEKSHNSTVGPHKNHYEFLKKLSEESLTFPLKIFNKIWTERKFPDLWRQTTVVPIPKPKKTARIHKKKQTYLLKQLLMQNNGNNNKEQFDLVFGIEQPYIQLTMRILQQERHNRSVNMP